MTVIVWDGKSLASDSLLNDGGLPRATQKIWKLPNGHVGFAGDWDAVLTALRWFQDGMPEDSRPVIDESVSGIYIDFTGQAFDFACALRMTPIVEPFHAVGTGRDFALAAMHLSCNANEAVQVACHFDLSCGGTIQEFRIRD